MGLGKLRFAMFFTFVVLFGTVIAMTGIAVWILSPSLYATSAYALLGFLFGMAIVMTLIQYLLGPYVIRAFTNMRPLDEKEYEWLHLAAKELAKKAGLKKVPKLYLVNDGTPNAFAFGYGKNHAYIALHTGLIEMLNKDEIKSVLAHEMGHVKHNDMVLITIATMMPIIVYYIIIAVGSILGSRDEDRGGISVIFVFIGAYIAQFFTYLILLYLTRTREYYADAFGAAATNPKDLRTSLAKITYGFPLISGKKIKKYEKTRAFYIADPIAAASEREQRDKQLGKDLEKSARKREEEGRHLDTEKEISEAMKWERERAAAKILNIFSTHPLTYKRIDNLYELEKEFKKGVKPEDV